MHSSPLRNAAQCPQAHPAVHRSLLAQFVPHSDIEEVAFIAQAWDNIWDIQDYEIQEAMTDLIAFSAMSNPETM
jgi:hypothetical protein